MGDYQYNYLGHGNQRYFNKRMHNCNCNCDCTKPTCTSIPMQINDCCCVNGIRKALLAIQCLVNKLQTPGLGMNLLITLESGVSYPVSMINGTANPVFIGNDIITFNNEALNLCEIVKIQVLTSGPSNTIFANLLLGELQKITTKCELAVSRDNDKCCCNNECSNIECEDTCCEKTDCCCAKGVQNYLNSNKSIINSIGYTGSYKEINSITVDSLTTTTIVKDISTTTTTIPAITSTTLSTSTTSVVNSVSTIPVSVVTTVPSVTTTLVSSVNNTNAIVSGPISTTPVTVVSNVTTVPQTLVTNITPTLTSFTSNAVVSNFPNPTIVSGVIGGITAATVVSTSPQTLTTITAAAGGLFVVIGGVTTPIVDSTGAPVTISASTIVNTLSQATNILNVTGTPTIISALTGLGAPTTISALSGAANGATLVVTTITATTISANLVNVVTQTSINNIAPTPTTVPVVSTITTVNTAIQGLGTVALSTLVQVSTVTSTTVLSGATLTNISTPVVRNFVVTPTFVDAIIDVTSSTITVVSPVTVPITGTIDSVGNGILVVKETNGNITIYSVCEIDSIATM